MFEEVAEILVAVILAFDIAITIALALLAIKWHRKYQFMKTENNVMLKKIKLVQTSNELMRDIVSDLKKKNVEETSLNAELTRKNTILSEKLESANDKIIKFSKMVKDIKNS